MRKPGSIIILLFVFIIAAALSFYFENNYQKLIRYLYSALTNNSITFEQPRKYIHFASGLFVVSFGLYATLLFYFLNVETTKQKIINAALISLLLPASICLYCYFDGTVKLIECTACKNGERILNYTDIHYDKIFVVSLIISLLPVLITEIKRNLKTRKL